MWRLRVLLIATVAACGEDPDRCKLDNVVSRYTEGNAGFDCGFLRRPNRMDPADEVTWRAAYDCARGHLSAQEDFVVLFELAGIDSYVADAYVGHHVGAVWTLSRFHHDNYGGATTNRLDCDRVDEVSPCTSNDLFGDLCLQCITPKVVDMCRAEEDSGI